MIEPQDADFTNLTLGLLSLNRNERQGLGAHQSQHPPTQPPLFVVFNITSSVFHFACGAGGWYPHPDVPPVLNARKVQKGVWYCPDVRFIAFDVCVTPRPSGVAMGAGSEVEVALREAAGSSSGDPSDSPPGVVANRSVCVSCQCSHRLGLLLLLLLQLLLLLLL